MHPSSQQTHSKYLLCAKYCFSLNGRIRPLLLWCVHDNGKTDKSQLTSARVQMVMEDVKYIKEYTTTGNR